MLEHQSKSLSEKRKKVEQKKLTDQKNNDQKNTKVKVDKEVPFDDYNWYPDQNIF